MQIIHPLQPSLPLQVGIGTVLTLIVPFQVGQGGYITPLKTNISLLDDHLDELNISLPIGIYDCFIIYPAISSKPLVGVKSYQYSFI